MSEPVGGPVLLIYVMVTAVPGLVVAAALGLRGWLLAAATPALTYGLVGIAGTTLPLAGLGWSPGTLTAVTVAVAAAAWFLRAGPLRKRSRTLGGADAAPPWRTAHHVGVALGVVIASGIGVLLAEQATRDFTAVPQIWDSIFHANATRYIADTGQSDPAALQALNNPDTPSFYYPNAYHVLAATVVMLTGTPVPAALDTSIALVPAVFALGIAALVRRSAGRPALAAAAALLSCAFTAFPYDLLPWGTLLPFIMAVALLPAFLALWSALLRSEGPTTVALPTALAVAGLGLVALHPSGAVAAAVFGALLLVQLWLERGLRRRDVRAVSITMLTAALLGAPLLLASSRAASTIAFDWPTTLRPGDAMGQLLFFSHEQPFPQYWLVALAVVGLLRGAAVLRPVLWFVAGSAVFAVLFVMASSYEGTLVALLTRPWWNDKWRFAALWTVGAVLLAAAGMVVLRDAAWRLLSRLAPTAESARTEESRLLRSSALLAATAMVVVLLSDGLYAGRNEARLAQGFTDGPTVSSAERQAFDRLAELVPDGGMVMNDPYDGSALMWALDDVRPVFATPVIPSQELPTMDPNRRLLFESFDRVDDDVAVRRAVEALDIQYVIICEGFVGPASDYAPGMRGLDGVRALETVFENEDARIYRIDRGVLAST